MDSWDTLAKRFLELWSDKGEGWLESSHREMLTTVKNFAAKHGGIVTEEKWFKDDSDIPKFTSGNPLLDAGLKMSIQAKARYPIVTIRHGNWKIITRIIGPAELPIIFSGKFMLVSQGVRFEPIEDFSLTLRANNAEWLSKPLENVIRTWPEVREMVDKKPKEDKGKETKSGYYDIDSQYILKTTHAKDAQLLLSQWRVREKLLAAKLASFAIWVSKSLPNKDGTNTISFYETARINSLEEMNASVEFMKSALDTLSNPQVRLITIRAPKPVQHENIFEF